MFGHLLRFMRDESGATAIEYCFIAGLIGLVIITAMGSIGSKLTGTFNNAANGLR